MDQFAFLGETGKFRQFRPHDLFAATALAGLPTAQNLFSFSSRYNQNVSLARDIVLLSTIAAIPALFVIAAIMA